MKQASEARMQGLNLNTRWGRVCGVNCMRTQSYSDTASYMITQRFAPDGLGWS